LFLESGEWRVASGEWRVASGEWRVASGEQNVVFLIILVKVLLYLKYK